MSKKLFVGLFGGLALVTASVANAGSITVGGHLGPGGNVNCGTGAHSTYLGSTVAEFTVDGLNGSVPYTPCPGSGPDAAYHDYGPVLGRRSQSQALAISA